MILALMRLKTAHGSAHADITLVVPLQGWSHILTAGWESVHSLAESQRIERQDASESPDYASTSDVDHSDYDSDNELEELTPEVSIKRNSAS